MYALKLVTAVFILVAGATETCAQERATLQVLATSDLHMYLKDYDYYTDRPDNDVGLVRVAPLIRQARAANPNTILVDNGDTIQGGPMGDWAVQERRAGSTAVHPAVAAMNALAYDAAVLGNHEFNFGLDLLERTYADAKFPVLAGNVFRLDGDQNPANDPSLYPAYALLERRMMDSAGQKHMIRIGVIGLLTPQIMTWDRDKLEGKVETRDIVDTARKLVSEIRAKGADVVVALSHAGLSPQPRQGGDENASAYLTLVDGIDAVVSGHSHRVFPGPDFKDFPGAVLERGTINGRPVVMPGSFGSHLGVITLTLEKTGGGWKVLDGKGEVRPIVTRVDNRATPVSDADPELVQSLHPAHTGTLAFVRQAVGRTTMPIHSYFSLIQDTPAIELVAEAQRAYMKKALQGRPEFNLPMLSAVAPFKSGGRPGVEYYTDIPAGEIAVRNVADLYVYPNQLTAVRMTGAQVREWLEASARIFNRIDPAKATPQMLVDRRVPSYNFDILDGLTYTIDVTQPSRYDRNGKVVSAEARRIKDLRYDGRPVGDDQVFIVVTNNYRANGGGSFPGMDGYNIVYQAPDTAQQAIIDHIRNVGTVTPSTDRTWRFAPVPGATIIFDSSPKAEHHLPEAPGLSVIGPGENGFTNFRLDLSEARQ